MITAANLIACASRYASIVRSRSGPMSLIVAYLQSTENLYTVHIEFVCRPSLVSTSAHFGVAQGCQIIGPNSTSPANTIHAAVITGGLVAALRGSLMGGR